MLNSAPPSIFLTLHVVLLFYLLEVVKFHIAWLHFVLRFSYQVLSDITWLFVGECAVISTTQSVTATFTSHIANLTLAWFASENTAFIDSLQVILKSAELLPDLEV